VIFFASAGLTEILSRAWAVESAPGEYISWKANVAVIASAATINVPHVNNGRGRPACRSSVGYQLNCALPNRLSFNFTVGSAPSLPPSPLRFSQKIFSACFAVKRPLSPLERGERRSRDDAARLR